MRRIEKAAVIGSGVMGAAIAAHLANVGISTYLLDIVPRSLTPEEEAKGLTLDHPAVRNRLATQAKARLLKTKPAPLYDPADVERITPGNLEDHLHWLGEADWIIEAVVENLDIKRQVLAKVDEHRRPDSIVSTNTSGISIHAMAEGRSDSFRQHFLGTHFFNPPRYLKLLEIIPHRDTRPEIVAFMRDFGERVLGKGVVLCKDTVNFVANRIGVYGLQVTVREMLRAGLGPDEVDSVTGPLMGRPKSATFRTLDVVGLDTYVNVARNVAANVDDLAEREAFAVPSFIEEMVKRGWLGEKAGQGFYKKETGEILALDIPTMTYRPRRKLKAPSMDAAKAAKDLPTRLRTLVYADDVAGRFAWNVLKKVLLYAAAKIPEIADDLHTVDNAMKWGFGWELGPFETWDAIGVARSVERMKAEGETIPAWVEAMLATGHASFYARDEGRRAFYVLEGKYRGIEEKPEVINLAALKEQGRVIRQNSGASLIDLGDGVACLEFHSPNNAIGADILQMTHLAIDEVERNFEGLVIGNQGKNFSVGANVALMLFEAQEENWDELDWMVREFQRATQRIKFAKKHVVAAPFGMTLGGGAEFCLPAAGIEAAAETYMGLVETGVGVIPAGGGCKELLLRYVEAVPEGAAADLQPLVNAVFETIALAKVSSSAKEAKKRRFLREADGITVNGDHLLAAAKRRVLELAARGYVPPQPKRVRVVGESGYAVLKLGALAMRESGHISDHDLKIADKLAYVLAGGRVPAGTEVPESYLLDLEREAFLSLLGEPKTQQRMQAVLATGRPIRN